MPTPRQLRFYGLTRGNVNDEGAECRICLDTVKEPVITACRHTFCWNCLHQWLLESVTCPTCRNNLLIAHEHQRGIHRSVTVLSNEIDAREAVHASETLAHSAAREDILVSPPLNVSPGARVVAVSEDTHSIALSDSHSERFQRSSRRYTPNYFPQSANDDGDRVDVPTLTLESPATRQAPEDLLLRASDNHDPTEHVPHLIREDGNSHDVTNDSATFGPRHPGPFITIDSQRMLDAMRAEANRLAQARGILYRRDYRRAATVVYRHWTRFFERKSGQTMLRLDVMWQLGQEANLALAEAAIVDFSQGEVVPSRLTKYLREIARAAVEL